jgi:hypothetical protein
MQHLCSLGIRWQPHRDIPNAQEGEYLVDGRPFAEYLPRDRPGRGLPSPLVRGEGRGRRYVESLLLRSPALFGIDRFGATRRELLICHCGDFGCGCVSAEISIADGCVLWSGFAYIREGNPLMLLKMGTLCFPLSAYEDALQSAVATGESI